MKINNFNVSINNVDISNRKAKPNYQQLKAKKREFYQENNQNFDKKKNIVLEENIKINEKIICKKNHDNNKSCEIIKTPQKNKTKTLFFENSTKILSKLSKQQNNKIEKVEKNKVKKNIINKNLSFTLNKENNPKTKSKNFDVNSNSILPNEDLETRKTTSFSDFPLSSKVFDDNKNLDEIVKMDVSEILNTFGSNHKSSNSLIDITNTSENNYKNEKYYRLLEQKYMNLKNDLIQINIIFKSLNNDKKFENENLLVLKEINAENIEELENMEQKIKNKQELIFKMNRKIINLQNEHSNLLIKTTNNKNKINDYFSKLKKRILELEQNENYFSQQILTKNNQNSKKLELEEKKKKLDILISKNQNEFFCLEKNISYILENQEENSQILYGKLNEINEEISAYNDLIIVKKREFKKELEDLKNIKIFIQNNKSKTECKEKLFESVKKLEFLEKENFLNNEILINLKEKNFQNKIKNNKMKEKEEISLKNKNLIKTIEILKSKKAKLELELIKINETKSNKKNYSRIKNITIDYEKKKNEEKIIEQKQLIKIDALQKKIKKIKEQFEEESELKLCYLKGIEKTENF